MMKVSQSLAFVLFLIPAYALRRERCRRRMEEKKVVGQRDSTRKRGKKKRVMEKDEVRFLEYGNLSS